MSSSDSENELSNTPPNIIQMSSSDSENELSNTPPNIIQLAAYTAENLLPENSRGRYEKLSQRKVASSKPTLSHVRYVVTADIAKMYRQILVDKSQTKLQRILWRFDPSDVIEEYELLTVTNGTASASYLAIKAMQQLAKEEAELYPTGSSIVLGDFYVDDLLTGANTINEAKTIINELTELLPKGGFAHRKWSSNCKELLNPISDSSIDSVCLNLFKDNIKTLGLLCKELLNPISDSSLDSVCLNLSKDNIKTLGLLWNVESDILQYQLNSSNRSNKITKRSILSKTSQLFDPLGLLSPIIIKAKVMMQRLWLLNITWDESVPTEIYSDWMQFESQLEYLKNITIKHNVG
ncbi:Pao retrotransposon peptidase [Popillia japonica]|uniref:Pao retrotransposon peptidase n=1 Tax=Popillia japonica TaxID=7064 RepID=A0AAW1LCQ0_POPJA